MQLDKKLLVLCGICPLMTEIVNLLRQWGGVEALVNPLLPYLHFMHTSGFTCARMFKCFRRPSGERAAGALWGLSVSEANSIAIGQGGGVAPLLTLARSEVEDVHETAAGALWNLAFYSGNALRIVEEGGVPVLVHICTSSGSKMARFMSALALAYMFDGRMDEVALVGTSSDSNSKSFNVEGARRIALKHIETFVLTFSDPHVFSVAAASSAPAALSQVAEAVFIHEAGHLRCSGAEIGRFVAMLRNPSSILRACAAFALLQCTTQVSCRKQEQVESCVQRQLQQQLLLKPKFLQESSSGTWSTISQGHQHDSTPSAEVHPPIRHSFTKGWLANAAQLKYQFRHCWLSKLACITTV
ncbi:hypothetical protein PR202_gb07460 [Eleusine coracana subsp. coracana]|uniref:Protein ARABIDILLO 1 n=1 Tax=Eleusine coracana subsp. coracana TaxID=191504 RepID=A0AAV5ED21_ELECO|nr:hypothetical protein PR202_gb07460 [Eleusine coracana subsp. coracana]